MAIITKEQRAHLLQRIQDRYAALRYQDPPEPPAKVEAARKLVQAWEADVVTARKTREAKVLRGLAAAREAVEFAASPEAALTAVRVFETLKV